MIKNTWTIEAKILVEKLEIPADFKVRFIRRNDKLTWISRLFLGFKNSEITYLAQKWAIFWTQCVEYNLFWIIKGSAVKS